MKKEKARVALVTGGAHGLGAAIVEQLSRRGYDVHIFDAEFGRDVRNPWQLRTEYNELDVLVNCAGVNRLNWLEDVTDMEWDEVMDVNVKGIFRMSQECIGALRATQGTILNIVSSAAHVPMRCSAAYNASKAAALMLTRQLARELAPQVTVFSVSPNRLAGTMMSHQVDSQVEQVRGWTPGYVAARQHEVLLPGEETPVSAVAELIGFLLQDKEHHKFLAGCDIPYGV